MTAALARVRTYEQSADTLRMADTEPTADFSSDGTISGNTGCNGFHDPDTLQRKKLDIGPLTATKKA